MPLMEFIGVSKDFAGSPVFSGVSFKVEPGDRLGIVGPNGSGKSTLLRILTGEDDDYRGTVVRSPRLKFGYAPQYPEFPPGATCVEAACGPALELRARLRELEHVMGGATGRSLDAALSGYGVIREEYDELGGDDAEERARRKLDKAGLGGRSDTPVDKLSGGEQNVLALVRALAADPALLVLDEPGNHLDFRGLAWLESFLGNLRSALVIVSHDRILLDRSVKRILELEGGRGTVWAGGFSRYRLEKGRSLASQGADWQADRKRIERLEALVKRFREIASTRPDPSWGKRLRARVSQLAREKGKATERPESGGSRITVSFARTDSRSDIAIDVRGYSRSFGDRVLFDGASFDLLVGERVALVGQNGSGKTTLVRDLVERGSWDDDTLRIGPSQRIGYCAQAQEVFRRDRTMLAEFEALGALERETRALLGKFGFGWGDLDKTLGSLSGGELNRLQIARAVFLKANLLVLDEPTNHLDIPSREAVEEGLEDFDGTILVVSHDRWFLERTTDRILFIEDGRVLPYEGSFAEFMRDKAPPFVQGVSKGMESRGRRVGKNGSARADERSPAFLEERIVALERKKAGLERTVAAAVASREYADASKRSTDLARVNDMIEKLYAQWR
ncbi:MAG: ABC-F family ATP-binding cassette domain-containing protein [Spirochaetes bacterium]|nr:ABC-F family ATP-binding cassette domain-containing protein [Spirochaetota bacterium]